MTPSSSSSSSSLLLIVLFWILSLLSLVDAWIGHFQFGRPPVSTRRTRHGTLHSSSLTKRSAFFWFGGDDGDSADPNNDIDNELKDTATTNTAATIASNLVSISNVMDSKLGSFKSSQRVGDKTGAALADLSNTLVEGSSDNGKIKVTMTGQQQFMGIQIDESYFSELAQRPSSKDALQELSLQLTSAMKGAHSKSEQKLQDKLKSLYQDLGF
ncbi:YbaB/EbfC DNA-binding family protein [Nitzschia inconspicua]|uniref:YbaB/EbfC DNA-binding family protein n=1 Tax=Nitzschia inconspicua TaxID=303405 RepID=A0A9K3KLC6_9STRA|nr:YbaB/EbfC DNA-binding family protein [Nitzschia inconspicua]